MRLSVGLGVVFVPFGLVFSSEYVAAARYASKLSDIAAGVMLPFGVLPPGGASSGIPEEEPTAAIPVLEETEPAVVADKPGRKGKSRQGNPGKSAHPAPVSSIYIDAQTVLRIANSGRRPSGRSVSAEGLRPAGVQVFGASSLGVGVRDGDVITKVAGVPVTSANQVIAIVVGARGSRKAAISAEVYRGQRKYTLTVEQPYLTGAEPPTDTDAGTVPSR